MPDRKTDQAIDFPAHQPESRQPEKQEGLYLDDLADGAVVEIETQHRNYRLVKRDHRHVRISGHPTYCPEPVDVEVEGSITGGSTLTPNPGFIGRGMYMVFKHPQFARAITTSRIREIHLRG